MNIVGLVYSSLNFKSKLERGVGGKRGYIGKSVINALSGRFSQAHISFSVSLSAGVKRLGFTGYGSPNKFIFTGLCIILYVVLV